MSSGSRVFIAAGALLAVTAACSGSGRHASGACQPVYAVQYETGYRSEAVAVFERGGHAARIGKDWITRAPSLAPGGKRVAVTWFDSAHEGRQTAIAVFDAGSKHRAIVRGTGGGEYPAWSPDGSTIAYARNDFRADAQEIRLFDAATGHHNRAITHQPGQTSRTLLRSPAWSSDGRRIAFIVNDVFSGPATVWVVDRSGAGLHQVASFTGADKVDRVSWRPNGAALLLSNGAHSSVLDLGTLTVHAITRRASKVVPVGTTSQIVYDRSSSVYRYLPREGTLRGTRIRHMRDLKGVPPRSGFPHGVVMAATCTS